MRLLTGLPIETEGGDCTKDDGNGDWALHWPLSYWGPARLPSGIGQRRAGMLPGIYYSD
jgi:hypothetical protein